MQLINNLQTKNLATSGSWPWYAMVITRVNKQLLSSYIAPLSKTSIFFGLSCHWHFRYMNIVRIRVRIGDSHVIRAKILHFPIRLQNV